jgi:hypothetical protein
MWSFAWLVVNGSQQDSQLRDHRRPFTDGAADPLHRARPRIAHCEYTRDIRFERQRRALRPGRRAVTHAGFRTRQDKSLGVLPHPTYELFDIWAPLATLEQ